MSNLIGRIKVIYHGNHVYIGGPLIVDPTQFGLVANPGQKGRSHGGVSLYDVCVNVGKLYLGTQDGKLDAAAFGEALELRYAGQPESHAAIGHTIPHHLFEDKAAFLCRNDYSWTPRIRAYHQPDDVVLSSKHAAYYDKPLAYIEVPTDSDCVYHNTLANCAIEACVDFQGSHEIVNVVPLYDWGLVHETVSDDLRETQEVIDAYPQVYYYQGPDNCSYVLRVDPTRFDIKKIMELGHLIGVDNYTGTSGLLFFNS